MKEGIENEENLLRIVLLGWFMLLWVVMSKIIGALLLVALAVRLVVLFFFKRNIVLNEISLVLFIAVFVVAVIVMLVKWWKWRTK